jgi:hypothetical protein
VTKVNINGGGHQVEVDHDGNDLSYVLEKAQKLWNETRTAPRGAGFGLAAPSNGGQPVVKP